MAKAKQPQHPAPPRRARAHGEGSQDSGGLGGHIQPPRVREPYAVTLHDGSRAWVYPVAWLAQQGLL